MFNEEKCVAELLEIVSSPSAVKVINVKNLKKSTKTRIIIINAIVVLTSLFINILFAIKQRNLFTQRIENSLSFTDSLIFTIITLGTKRHCFLG